MVKFPMGFIKIQLASQFPHVTFNKPPSSHLEDGAPQPPANWETADHVLTTGI